VAHIKVKNVAPPIRTLLSWLEFSVVPQTWGF
jgi:hypothetical protein